MNKEKVKNQEYEVGDRVKLKRKPFVEVARIIKKYSIEGVGQRYMLYVPKRNASEDIIVVGQSDIIGKVQDE